MLLTYMNTHKLRPFDILCRKASSINNFDGYHHLTECSLVELEPAYGTCARFLPAFLCSSLALAAAALSGGRIFLGVKITGRFLATVTSAMGSTFGATVGTTFSFELVIGCTDV